MYREPGNAVDLVDQEEDAKALVRVERHVRTLATRRKRAREQILRGTAGVSYVASIIAMGIWFQIPGVLVALACINLYCLVALWRSQASATRRALWTPLVLVPLFGPVLFGAVYDGPIPPSSEG